MDSIRRAGNAAAILGTVLFVIVLFLSAYWESDIRGLHLLQSMMYVAAVALILKGSKWGYFIGLGAGLFWNYVNLFVTTFLKSGLAQAGMYLHTGHMDRPDLFVAVPGWAGNALLIIGCLAGYAAMSKKQGTDMIRFAVATAGTTGFFALSMYLCQPRYLALFPRLLHPHLHI
jgi:hypothetical protein